MSGQEEIWFVFQKLRYVYDAEEKKQFQEVRLPVDLTFQQYMDWKGYQDDEELRKAEKTYSKNKYLITVTYSTTFCYYSARS